MTLDLITPKKYRPKTYKESREIHFRRRFFERVGYWISDANFASLTTKTQREGKFLYKSDSGGLVFSVKWGGSNLKIVAQILPFELVTVLPINS